MDLVVRDLDPAHRPAALTLLAQAFVDEPYVVEAHGDDPDVRRAALHARYAAEDPALRTLQLGVYAGSALVGALLGSLPGTCVACATAAGADPGSWRGAVGASHARQPEHLWVGRLGVDPTRRGAGAAAGLLHAAVSRGRALATVTLLECQAHRVGYYERRGFTVVDRVADPPGADGAVLRRD